MKKIVLSLYTFCFVTLPHFTFGQYNPQTGTNPVAMTNADAKYFLTVEGLNKKTEVEKADTKYFKNQGGIIGGTDLKNYTEKPKQPIHVKKETIETEEGKKTKLAINSSTKNKGAETNNLQQYPKTTQEDTSRPNKEKTVEKSVTISKNPSLEKDVSVKGNIANDKEPVVSSANEQADNIKQGFYIVGAGETMYRVSVNTKVSVNKIKELNKLKNNNIYPGTKLIIK